MLEAQEYSLLDFGSGRKLERFGEFVFDRPSPAADGITPSNPGIWRDATAKFTKSSGQSGRWTPSKSLPAEWTLNCGDFRLQLRPTPFGHLGVFPEQQQNWAWIARQIRRHGKRPRVLNLFAYTGGSTLAAASAGAEVVHVDAAKNIVQWARRNAEVSGLEEAPIRWIVEDAATFVRRELKRGNHYDAIILDPPSYGHGPTGGTWKLGRDLMQLLKGCGQLTQKNRLFLLLTCHSPGYGAAELSACLEDAVFGRCQSGATTRQLSISTSDGRKLDAGVVARWP